MEYIQKELRRPGVTLNLLWEEYKKECELNSKVYLSYSSLCRMYKKYVAKHGFANLIYHKPGERVEVDWAGVTMSYFDTHYDKKMTVYLFVADLVCSRLAYVEPCLSMDTENWIRCNVNMLEFFGGVPKTIICDNLKTGVTKNPKLGEIILNHEYESMMYHYNTAILPADVKAPRQKNSTEGTVGNIETDIIAALRNVQFYSFAALKKAVSDQLLIHNTKPFTKRPGSRMEYFLENEKEFLGPLPSSRYEFGLWHYDRVVQSNCHVAFERNFYSVPFAYQGQHVDLKVNEGSVSIYKGSKLLKTHKRCAPGIFNKHVTDLIDMPPGTVDTPVNANTYRRWASQCGPNTSEVVERILLSKPIIEQAFNSVKAILRLSEHFTRQRLEAACELALGSISRPMYPQIKAILDSQQDVKLLKEENKPTNGILRGAQYYSDKFKNEKKEDN